MITRHIILETNSQTYWGYALKAKLEITASQTNCWETYKQSTDKLHWGAPGENKCQALGGDSQLGKSASTGLLGRSNL